MLTKADIEQLQAKGITKEQIESQMNDFKQGFPFMQLNRPARHNDGIIVLDADAFKVKSSVYDQYSGSILKFVPASGAASRMFKSLFAFLEAAANNPDCIHDPKYNEVKIVVERIKDFAFYNEIKEIADSGDPVRIVEAILSEKGLNYGQLPKGLLLFHQYENGSRTALEEHLVEGALYAKSSDNQVNIHFTVSPEHMDGFKSKVAEVIDRYQKKYQVTYNVEYSVQKSSTDTLAVDLNNEPFREDDGSMLFRPGGHGALLENLNDLKEDIIFIKNIDNVVPDKHKDDTIAYKKALAGVLLETKDMVFNYLGKLDNDCDDHILKEIYNYTQQTLCIEIDTDFDNLTFEEKKDTLKELLNRPIRVCGMVKNEGEPGGGPFWAKNGDGHTSLQVVEQAQIDENDPDQQRILKSVTHFNPVDLICFTKDRHGNKFDLLKFRDPKTGFISKKSKSGKELKALELPGLWNGAMANWITLFVEVSVETFNPVKTINDLLRAIHQ